MREHVLQTPQFIQRMQRLYDRYDLLCDACHNIQWAADALKQCRDVRQAENLAVLEQIGGELSRDRDATHAKLEQMEALEQAALVRESTGLYR